MFKPIPTSGSEIDYDIRQERRKIIKSGDPWSPESVRDIETLMIYDLVFIFSR